MVELLGDYARKIFLQKGLDTAEADWLMEECQLNTPLMEFSWKKDISELSKNQVQVAVEQLRQKALQSGLLSINQELSLVECVKDKIVRLDDNSEDTAAMLINMTKSILKSKGIKFDWEIKTRNIHPLVLRYVWNIVDTASEICRR